jgi:hypothetical protein
MRQLQLPGRSEVKAFTIAAIIVALTMPAYAQFGGVGSSKSGKSDAEKADEEKQEKRNEKAYRDSLKHIPKSDQKIDPWAKMR